MIGQAVAAGARKRQACEVIGVSIRTLQGWSRSLGVDQRHTKSKPPSNALSAQERELLLAAANSQEYRDLSPKQIVPRLANLGVYFGSESTLYRLLHDANLMAHRSPARPATHRAPKRRDATGPNQIWSWDITCLRRRDEPGRFYYLYLFVDVWSRFVVGWSVEESESDELAAALLTRIAHQLGIDPAGIILHSDNGRPMRGIPMVITLQLLGMLQSLSRPGVSNDNPFSESLFKTLKYRPGYPARGFSSLADAHVWVTEFVRWYNDEHLHSQVRHVTPRDRHFGHQDQVLATRAATLEAARAAHPERWTGRKIRNCTPIQIVTMHPGVRAFATTGAVR